MYPFARELAIESWILYAVAVLTGDRVSRRIRLKSWSKLQMDDALMCVIALTFTGVTITANITAWVSSDPIVQEEYPTPHAKALMVWANKAIFMLEQFALVTIWLVKGCLLIIYSRLTLMMKEHLVVKIVAVYVVISFIVIEVLLLGVWCRPINHYWDIESIDFQCGTYFNHLITTTVFNISSDVMMLCIPLPLFIRSHLPFKQKVAVCAVFSLGGIVILMAALNKYYNFSNLTNARFLKWYVAEVATAVYVSNVPLLWPLLRQVFRCLRSTVHSNYPPGAPKSSGPQRGLAPLHSHSRSHSRYRTDSAHSIINHSHEGSMPDAFELVLTPTRERGYRADIMGDLDTSPQQSKDITVHRTVEVTHEYP
ncbi:hypothetical protein ABOM_004666 [Aspergillus bombycis]|uniref:Rhodopsin domain-containing protein n=1 Tax=Aspergillus bombycis TaxID=109264 RepID=A0A1F8A4E0_9EURO|nr:hypothetical protein ABOM_004666 [Aspergillus bombycis]OGM46612.1 hypothetical protein ABOM_004666 [Aspergillus bombycis]